MHFNDILYSLKLVHQKIISPVKSLLLLLINKTFFINNCGKFGNYCIEKLNVTVKYSEQSNDGQCNMRKLHFI